MSFGDPNKIPDWITAEKSREIIERPTDLGITFFDTPNAYSMMPLAERAAGDCSDGDLSGIVSDVVDREPTLEDI